LASSTIGDSSVFGIEMLIELVSCVFHHPNDGTLHLSRIGNLSIHVKFGTGIILYDQHARNNGSWWRDDEGVWTLLGLGQSKGSEGRGNAISSVAEIRLVDSTKFDVATAILMIKELCKSVVASWFGYHQVSFSNLLVMPNEHNEVAFSDNDLVIDIVRVCEDKLIIRESREKEVG
jgi:hypothetical protein